MSRSSSLVSDDRRMIGSWNQRITISGLPGEAPYKVYCEPEGAVQDVEPGDVLTFVFAGANPHGFELSLVSDGLVLCRLGDSDVTISDKRGRQLRW